MALLLCLLVTSVSSLTYETFRAPGVTLKSGQIANTPGNFGPLPFPPGQISVRHFGAELVDENNNTIPLDEIYVHHWLIYDGALNGGLCPNLPNIWGIGAEMYGVTYDYPPGYGVVLSGEEHWTVNLHLIRTTDVPDVQMCIECHCKDAKLPNHPHGSVDCCVDRTQCWGMENSTINNPKTYYLQYTVGYEPVQPNTIPLTIFSLDATARDTYDCHIEYDIPEMQPGEINVLKSVTTVPSKWEIVYMSIHQHIGGLNFTVEHWRNGENLGVVCMATPIYGNGTGIGNEKGYLVDIPPCKWETPYVVLGGDELRLTSVYGPRTLPGGHGWHEGVMALVFLAAHAEKAPVAVCLDKMHELCGMPPYLTTGSCMDCVADHEGILRAHSCTSELVIKECAKTWADGNVPVPDELSKMTLRIAPAPDGNATIVTATGPSDAWFAVGYNPSEALMDGAVAFVYTVDDNGNNVVQERALGNHNSGKVVNANYPAHITVADGVATIEFNYAADSPTKFSNPMFEQNCFLFAQGTSGKMQLEYHGSSRGFSCSEI